jgi:lipopolysaccharide transport system ATP-binding protein
MSEGPVISVQHVTKAYRIWESPAARLTSPLQAVAARLFPSSWAPHRWLRARAARHYRDFLALDDVSFEVRRGECWGVVGRNGSGKSTLLQIIAGTLQPSSGSVQVHGRVAALLELGSGFNPEFTGRENVYLNGAVLGLTREEMARKFPEIAAFADIGDFLEQPVKTYSSGMLMRLAFAVQTAVDPDVLIIDEALSVGDAPFQAKCFARLRRLLDGGCTILFVSHDVATVRTFCQQALWLQQGRPASQGAAPVVCDAYNRDCFRAMGMDFPEALQPAGQAAVAGADARSRYLREDRAEFQGLAALERRGNGTIQLLNFFFATGEGNQRSSVIKWDEPATAVYVIGSDRGYEGLFQCGLVVKTVQGQELLCCSDRRHDLRLRLAPGEEAVVTLRTQLPLRSGKYVVTTGLFLFPDDARLPIGTYDFTRSTVADFIPCSAAVSIPPQFGLGIYGPVQLEAQLAIPSE